MTHTQLCGRSSEIQNGEHDCRDVTIDGIGRCHGTQQTMSQMISLHFEPQPMSLDNGHFSRSSTLFVTHRTPLIGLFFGMASLLLALQCSIRRSPSQTDLPTTLCMPSTWPEQTSNEYITKLSLLVDAKFGRRRRLRLPTSSSRAMRGMLTEKSVK